MSYDTEGMVVHFLLGVCVGVLLCAIIVVLFG